jgi:hypothetical protein
MNEAGAGQQYPNPSLLDDNEVEDDDNGDEKHH